MIVILLSLRLLGRFQIPNRGRDVTLNCEVVPLEDVASFPAYSAGGLRLPT